MINFSIQLVWAIWGMLHVNSYHAIWSELPYRAIHMKLLKPKMTGQYMYQKPK